MPFQSMMLIIALCRIVFRTRSSSIVELTRLTSNFTMVYTGSCSYVFQLLPGLFQVNRHNISARIVHHRKIRRRFPEPCATVSLALSFQLDVERFCATYFQNRQLLATDDHLQQKWRIDPFGMGQNVQGGEMRPLRQYRYWNSPRFEGDSTTTTFRQDMRMCLKRESK